MDNCGGIHCPGCTAGKGAQARHKAKLIIYSLGALTLTGMIFRKPIAHAALIAWHVMIIAGLVIIGAVAASALGALSFRLARAIKSRPYRATVYVATVDRGREPAAEPAVRRLPGSQAPRALPAGPASLTAPRAPRAQGTHARRMSG